jgi:hypothetical protein
VKWLSQTYTGNFERHGGPNTLLPIMHGWDLLMKLLLQGNDKRIAVFHASDDWVLAVVHKEFIDGIIAACVIAILCASASVIVFIGNIAICLAVVFTIMGILISLVSTLVLLNVKFGLIEAVSLAITVGLSVDYITHLGLAYSVSSVTTRKLKSYAMLKERGRSVSHSGISSMLSICLLFACQVPIFVAFARVFALLIGFSLIWSLLGFSSVLMIFGPSGKQVPEEAAQEPLERALKRAEQEVLEGSENVANYKCHPTSDQEPKSNALVNNTPNISTSGSTSLSENSSIENDAAGSPRILDSRRSPDGEWPGSGGAGACSGSGGADQKD